MGRAEVKNPCAILDFEKLNNRFLCSQHQMLLSDWLRSHTGAHPASDAPGPYTPRHSAFFVHGTIDNRQLHVDQNVLPRL